MAALSQAELNQRAQRALRNLPKGNNTPALVDVAAAPSRSPEEMAADKAARDQVLAYMTAAINFVNEVEKHASNLNLRRGLGVDSRA